MVPERKNSARGDEVSRRSPLSGCKASGGSEFPRILKLPEDVDPLNPLTIGHVVLGYLLFRARFLEHHPDYFRLQMLDRQDFVRLEAAQHQLDAGLIDRERFATRVEQSIRDPAANTAFVGLSFWGAAVKCPPRHRFSRMLQLTTAQRRRARTIYRELHGAIEAERTKTHDEIRGALNSRQTAILDDPRSALRARDEKRRSRPFFEDMIEACDLQPDQQSRVAVLCALLRSDVRTQHERSRQRFLRALSPSQQRLLEVIENVPPLTREKE